MPAEAKSTREAAASAISSLNAAGDAVDKGEYNVALDLYNLIVRTYPDLALSEYARIGRALLLYQVGSVSDAILELEDEEVALRGNPEVHAALAVILYNERPLARLQAEQQWDIAMEFDQHYENVDWVREHKHWPTKMISGLDKFLRLQ